MFQPQQNQQKVVVYTPESKLRHPLDLFKEMWHSLLASRELAWQLLLRDLKAQYRQSFLGFFWAFVPAIATGIGLTLANNAKIINIGETDLPYPAYVMFSMTLWQTFVESINSPIAGVNAAKQMMAKINFPQEAVIIAKLGQVFFNFGIKLILIIGLFIWFRFPVSWQILIAPVALIHLVALGTFIGVLLAPVGALYQDVQSALTFIISGWLFLTPVIFPPPKEGIFSVIVNLNPVTPLLVTTRELATGAELSHPVGFWVASAIALIGLLIAWIFYRLAMPFMIERMSA
jgi:lipopolysaccharide transport system permease protein